MPPPRILSNSAEPVVILTMPRSRFRRRSLAVWKPSRRHTLPAASLALRTLASDRPLIRSRWRADDITTASAV